MARRKGVLSGSALSDQSKVARDLPSVGTKDFLPTHSWLEGKQVEKCLEKQLDLVGEQRIELLSSISTAEWCPKERKAKLIRKVGKHFEVLGHHLNNEDWLFPEEALYLLEIKCLELFFGGVRLSIEKSYSLLLESYEDKCSLQEYLTYSYLSRMGYKVLRHSPDIKLTKYEKDIRMDNVIKQQKRDVNNLGESSSVISAIEMGEESRDSQSPFDDVIVLSPVENIITIDDDEDEEEVLVVETKNDDVVFLASYNNSDSSRHWYLPKKYFIVPTKEVVNLCDDEDETAETEEEKQVKDLKIILDLIATPRRTILDSLPDANSGVFSIKTPDPRLLPPQVVPIHTFYEVNLNIKNCPSTPAPEVSRPRHSPVVRQQYPTALLRQVQDMQTLFYGMVQATSSIMRMLPPTGLPSSYADPAMQNHVLRQMNMLGRYWSLPTRRPLGQRPPLLGDHPLQARLPSTHNLPQSHPLSQYYAQYSHPQHPSYAERAYPSHSQHPSHSQLPSHSQIPSHAQHPYYDHPAYSQHPSYSRRSEAEYLSRREQYYYDAMYRQARDQYYYNNYRYNPQTYLGQSQAYNYRQYNRNYPRNNRRPAAPQKEKPEFSRPKTPAANTKTGTHIILLDSDDDDDVTIVEDKKRPLSPSRQVSPKKVKTDVKDTNLKVDLVSDGESSGAAFSRSDDGDGIIAKVEKDAGSDCMEISDIQEKVEVKRDQDMEETLYEDSSSVGWLQIKRNSAPKMDNSSDFDIEPLVNPNDHPSFDSALKALQIFKSHEQSTTRDIKISFDVYSSNERFKKSHKILPHRRVIVLNRHDDLPTSHELKVLKKIYQDEVPFLFSIVTDEEISFYNYDSISLPSLS